MNFDQISKYLYEDYFLFEKEISITKLQELYKLYPLELPISLTNNFIQSFLHKSFKHENTIELGNNEKLEFLGDSVLQIIISEKLYKLYPNKAEGELSKIRSAVVNEDSLAKIARALDLGKWILLGKGELKELGHTKNSILSDTFEAVLGAIYLDSSLEKAEAFLSSCIGIYELKSGENLLSDKILNSFDAKTKLQEIVMKKFKETPEYKWDELEVKGQKVFKVELIVNSQSLDQIVHPSKKKAMQILAKQVLEKNLI
jgi:ribonuclease-3